MLFPERSVEPLRDLLTEIFEDEKVFKIMPKRARKRAEKLYDLRKNVRTLIDIFKGEYEED